MLSNIKNTSFKHLQEVKAQRLLHIAMAILKNSQICCVTMVVR